MDDVSIPSELRRNTDTSESLTSRRQVSVDSKHNQVKSICISVTVVKDLS